MIQNVATITKIAMIKLYRQEKIKTSFDLLSAMDMKATLWVLNPWNSAQLETFAHVPVIPALRLRQGGYESL